MKRLLLFLVLGVILYAHYQSTPDQSAPPAPTVPPNPCESDWRKCSSISELINTYNGIIRAQSICKQAANDQARFGSPEWPWLPFGNYSDNPKGLKKGIITMFENDAKFQNGFGAMAKVRVSCTYDLAKEQAVLVLVDQK